MAFNPLSGGKTLFFASGEERGIFRSDDGGMTWLQYWQGMSEFDPMGLAQILCLESDTNVLLTVSSGSGMFRSTTGGQTWHLAEPEVLGGILGEAITWHRETDALYYGQNYRGPVWKSVDHGATWQMSGDTSQTALCTIAISPDEKKRLLAGSGDGGIALSTTEGAQWRSVFDIEDTNEILRPEVPKIVWSLHAPNVVIATRWLSKQNNLIRSFDAGETWSSFGPMEDKTWALELDQRRERTTAFGPRRIWIGMFNRGDDTLDGKYILESNDGGDTWIKAGLPDVKQVWMVKHDTTSDRLVAATSHGIYVTTAKSTVRPQEQDRHTQFSINPASTSTTVILPNGILLHSVELFDACGRRVLTGDAAQIGVGSLANGAYHALLRTSDGDHRLLLIVQH